MTPRTTTPDVDVSRHEEEINRQRAAWMAAAQVGDRVAYERLLYDCIPFIKRVARGQGVRFDFIDDVVQETLLTARRGIPTIRTAHSRRGSGPSRSDAPLMDCAAPPERGRAKFMNHSPM
jgi:hypothetical protein